MTQYFVRKTGSDGAAGTSAGAAWATIQKAHNAAAGPAGGDTVYIGAGTYRETVTASMTNPASELKFIADVDGAQTGDAGEVVWTAYTTNDTTAPAASPVLNLNGRPNLTYQGFTMVGGNSTSNGQCVQGTTSGSTGIKLQNCNFLPGATSGPLVRHTTIASTASNWTVDSCSFEGVGDGFQVNPTLNASADNDVNILVTNCLFTGALSGGVAIATSGGSGTFKPGGVRIRNCTFNGRMVGVNAAVTNISTSIPCTVENSIFVTGASVSLGAITLGQITEDYNLFIAASARTNVTAGTHSISDLSRPFLVEMGQSLQRGAAARPFMMPMSGSPLLGFGNAASAPTTDYLGKPRPEGGGSTSAGIGYLERHDTAAKETGTVRTGANAINITGPGSQEFQVPVDATSTTLSVYARYDSTHAATNKPQMIVTNGGEIGVSTATATMTAAADTWEQLSLTFTPTAKGFVTIRLVSRSAGGSGKAFFDDFSGGATGTQGFDYFRRGEPLDTLVAASAGGSAGFRTIGSQFIRGVD